MFYVTFEVTSKFPFPIDMLRYDGCYPRLADDAAVIEQSLTQGGHRPPTGWRVTLTALSSNRWTSAISQKCRCHEEDTTMSRKDASADLAAIRTMFQSRGIGPEEGLLLCAVTMRTLVLDWAAQASEQASDWQQRAVVNRYVDKAFTPGLMTVVP